MKSLGQARALSGCGAGGRAAGRWLLLLPSVAGALTVHCAAAVAQDVQPAVHAEKPAVPQKAPQKGSSVEDVTVTARKRTETLQNVPESIQSVGAKELFNAHITQIDDLATLVSNLNIETRGDQTPDVVLRGVGSFGVVQGVGFFANDVQLFDGQTVRPEDLQRIEVLKGPQGTLYGGANIGGAIKYVTKLPTDELQGQIYAEYGNYNTRTFSGILSGPLVPGVLDARVSIFQAATDGYQYDRTLNGIVDYGNEIGGRLTLRYTGQDTTATLYLNGDRYRTGGANLYYTPSGPAEYTLEVNDGTRPSFERSLWSAALDVEHRLTDDVTLTSLASFFQSNAPVLTDVDKGPRPILTEFQNFDRLVWSEELRLSNGGSGPFHWLAGVFAQGNDPSLLSRATTFVGPADPNAPPNFGDPAQFMTQTTNARQRHREYALFANGTYDFGRWSFEAGLRGDYNDSSLGDTIYGVSQDQHGIEFLPRFSVSYHFEKDVVGYATISRGFEPGDLTEYFNAFGTPAINHYGPETTWNYELGIKARITPAIRFNAAGYYISYANRLFQTNILQDGQFVNFISNIGPSHNYGGEFDATVQLTPDLLLTGAFGVTEAIWDNVSILNPNIGDGTTRTNLDGLTAPFTPEYQGSLSLDYTHPLTERLIFGARADAEFLGRQFWDPYDHDEQKPYQLLNLGVRLEYGGWILSGHVSNVTDTRYNLTYINAAELGAPFNVAGIGRPRLWTLRATYRF